MLRESALGQAQAQPSPPPRGDVLRIAVRAGERGYLASIRQVQDSHFGDERELARDVPFAIPGTQLRALSTDRERYGEALTDAFFAHPELRAAWQRARDQAERLGGRLQVRIEIDPSAAELHYVCWETLQDPERRRFLAQSTRTPVVRYIHGASGVPLVAAARTQLRALVVIAGAPAPAGYALPRIDVAAECSRICAALGPIPTVLLGTGVAGAPPASIGRIREALRGRFGILYVVCHGVLGGDEAGQPQPFLWLENEQGTLALVRAQQLVDVIESLDGPLRPTLVVFSSCYSVEDEPPAVGRRPFQAEAPIAVAPRLAAAGVGAVIGMQGRVKQQFVARFVPALFARLFAGEPIDSALATARADNGEADWWVPVLYLRGDNPYLWRPAEERITGEALSAAPGLLEHGPAREVIARFRHDLVRACEQLPLLKAYKDIHDQLHDLLVRGVRCIQRDLGPRLGEPGTALEFQAYYDRATSSIRLLFEAASRLPQGSGERRRIAQLARAYARLAGAVERPEPGAFAAALEEIASALGTLPVATNQSIMEQVRVLQIDQLSSMLHELQRVVAGSQRAATVQLLFTARAHELQRLRLDLQALVERHAAWQELDVIVRLLEQQGDTALVPYHWEELQLQLDAVAQLEPPATGEALHAHAGGLERAFAAGDEPAALRALDRLALEVRYRFFAADKQLKERCDGLQPLGAECRLLLDVLTL